jgi:hypothetical protein
MERVLEGSKRYAILVWNDCDLHSLRVVPALAILKVKVYDKDENQYMDDYVGKFKITDVYVGGLREVPILSLLRNVHGTFCIEVSHLLHYQY